MEAFQEYFKPGFLEVIAGPMNSGKTEAIISHFNKLRFVEGLKFQVFKPIIDDRFSKTEIASKNGSLLKCVCLDHNNPMQILEKLEENTDVIGIDEINFFNKDILLAINQLIAKGKHIIVSGLDLDFRGEPFGAMPELLCMADKVTKLFAVCEFAGCKASATRTQRLINGEPAKYDSPQILVGDKDFYQARCKQHHFVPK